MNHFAINGNLNKFASKERHLTFIHLRLLKMVSHLSSRFTASSKRQYVAKTFRLIGANSFRLLVS